MIKKRKIKGKCRKGARKRKKEDMASTTSFQQIVQPKKRRKKTGIITTKREKKNEEDYVVKDDSVTNVEKKKVDLATKIEEINIKKLKNVRLNSEVDFMSIGICRDYQRTGFCGWGDTCIYAHIREDYKSSYEVTKDFEEERRREAEGIGSDSDSDSDDDETPTICMICKEDFKEAVVTECQHYFCSSCILDSFKESGDHECPVCGMDTKGVLNSAENVVEKFKRMKEKEEEEENCEKLEVPEKKIRKYTSGWHY